MLDPWVGKIPWSRNGYPLQYSCLGNPRGGGALRATVRGAESRTRLNMHTPRTEGREPEKQPCGALRSWSQELGAGGQHSRDFVEESLQLLSWQNVAEGHGEQVSELMTLVLLQV